MVVAVGVAGVVLLVEIFWPSGGRTGWVAIDGGLGSCVGVGEGRVLAALTAALIVVVSFRAALLR